MLRRGAILIAALLAAFLGGCDSGSEPDGAYVGTYSLVSVNGDSLPVFLGFDKETGEAISVVGADITLDANGMASNSYLFRVGLGAGSSEKLLFDKGIIARRGSKIVIDWDNAAFETFALTGNELTLQNSDFVNVFRK